MTTPITVMQIIPQPGIDPADYEDMLRLSPIDYTEFERMLRFGCLPPGLVVHDGSLVAEVVGDYGVLGGSRLLPIGRIAV